MRFSFFLIFFLFIFKFNNLYGMNLGYVNYLSEISYNSLNINANNLSWIANIKIDNTPSTYRRNDSEIIFKHKDKAKSIYDSSVIYDINRFYDPKKTNIQLGYSFITEKPGRIFSLGYDNGLKTKKLKISKSYFVGYVETFNFKKNNYLTFNASIWLGGTIKEDPCIDSYNRKYWCQNFLAWSDYNPKYERDNFYNINLKYKKRFNLIKKKYPHNKDPNFIKKKLVNIVGHNF